MTNNNNQNDSSGSKDSTYTVLEQPLGSMSPVKIITIGAGASGLNMIRTLQKNISLAENVVYEKNPDIGGTWFENRYPGCQCDIPSHNYQFSWATNPSWSKFYSPAPEIHQYLKHVAIKEGLYDSVRLNHQVEHAEWNEEEGMWHVRVRDLGTDTIKLDSAHFLLDGSGILNNWKWPDIPGLDKFQGELVHSANWDENFVYKEKRVAVIGNGSSGVQIVPAMQPDVKTLVHFFRSPTWIAPGGMERMTTSTAGEVVSQLELDGEFFSSAQIEKFKNDGELYKQFVKSTEEVVNNKFDYLVNSKAIAPVIKEAMTKYMQGALKGNEKLIEKLVPDFPFGCRRITPSPAYLEAFHKSNVQVVTDGIKSIYEKGLITTEDENIEVDAIVCATGFDVSFCPRFPIIGRKGNLQDIWTQELPSSYMSMAVPGMPNYFTFLGPNAPIGHGSVLTITELASKYITRIIQKCQEECIKSIVPKQQAVDELSAHIAAFMPRTAWSGSCRSWFKNGEQDGPVTALHPGSRIHWFHMLQKFRGEDFDYTHWTNNSFSYLGNGYSSWEDPGKNSTWYLDEPDKMI